MDITIRRAVSADAVGLAHLAARTFRDTFAADNDPENIALHLAQAYGPLQQGRELADPSITTLLAFAGNQLVAYTQLRRGKAPICVAGDEPIELWRLYVAREWHGRGVAQDLMRAVELEARRAGARTLWLGVWEHNQRAQAFYRKDGFVDVGWHVFTVGSDVQTDRIMVRPVAHVPTPRFPAICISPGDSFKVVAEPGQLEAASSLALKNGYFDRLYLFDSAGERWRVARVETTSARPEGPFGKAIGIRLSFTPPDAPSVSEVAEALCQLVDSDPDDLYDQFITHDELKALFRSAVTPGELIAAAASLGHST
jgi:ribosomal protein S18 acetylase RimI-like enzyme